MVDLSCILPSASKELATKVVDKLSKEQLDKWNISSDDSEVLENRKADAINAIQHIIEWHVGKETNPTKRSQMLQDIDGFIHDLETYFTVAKVSDDEIDEAQEQYDSCLQNIINLLDTCNICGIPFEETEEDQNDARTLLSKLSLYNKVISKPSISYYKNGKIKNISFILMQPQKIEGKTKQQLTLDTLEKIRNLTLIEIADKKGNLDYVRTHEEIPDGWHRTGKYQYNGKIVKAKSVSKDVHGDEEYTGPVLAAPIGDGVDSVGRMFFDETSELWQEGKLITDDDSHDEELQNIINTQLRGLFTVQGLKNLISDFKELKRQFNEKWNNGNSEGLVFISSEIHFFGKDSNDQWIVGKPDLLVIDKEGIIHTIDFKTVKMWDIKGYVKVFNPKYSSAEDYGKQVSRYIKMEESYGINVDFEPYIVAIDTWYDGSDTVAERNNRYDLGKSKTDQITLTEEGITLGEYAAREGNPTREDAFNADKTVLYMEPRLHVAGYKEGEGFSEELAALRGKEDIPFDDGVSYEDQYQTLSKEDQDNLKWLNGSPVTMKTAQGVVTLSSNDIESNPELMGSQEIQDVAEFMMYRVSRTVTRLQNGEYLPEFPLSQHKEDKESPLKGRSREDIIKRVGIDNLLDYAFKTITDKYREDFPTEEQYENGEYDDFEFEFENKEDYQKQKLLSNKAKWLIDHKEQFIVAGSAKLMALENSIIPTKDRSKKLNPTSPNMRLEATDTEALEDNGDNEAIQTYVDMLIDGLTDIEAWMLGQRNYSPKASLAQEIKRIYEDLDMVDSNGKLIKDSYGWGFEIPVDATQAIQTTLDTCKNCETIEEMETALRDLARTPSNSWVNQILEKINADKNLKKKFFRHFRKDALNYSIAQVRFDKKTGKRLVETRIVNSKSAYDTITQSLGASFNHGRVGTFIINGVSFSLISTDASGKNVLTKYGDLTVAAQVKKKVKEWTANAESIQDDRSVTIRVNGKGLSKEEKHAKLAELLKTKKFKVKGENKEQTIVEGLTEILQAVGILVPAEVVENFCLMKVQGKKGSNAASLLNYVNIILTELANQKDDLPSSLKGLHAGRGYFPLLQKLADNVQEFVEASVYQDGKTYFSYTNPSRIGHIVRNLKDALGDPEKFEKYIETNFSRYSGWFKDVNGEEWFNDWVRQFTTSGEARAALAHKVELSYIGNQYKNLGALGFQLSILHNYFGSRDDNSVNKNYRWFALPTMSNKPTNEFLRMLKYKNNEEIIDKVLMKTFQQEMNRIADVLFHYTHHTVATDQIDLTDKKLRKAGWTDEEIKRLKDRIDNQSLMPEDIIRLSSITSGAKFHFLWYLNESIAQNEDLAFRITNRINLLLAPDSDTKNDMINPSFESATDELVRATIVENMEQIVENELEEMRKIGLFDKETKKIKVNGKTKEIEVLKYQEEFNGNLGTNEHGQGEQEMENALRDFIWQDIAANINIIQITGDDLAYYGNAVNYQKRIAQIHSPGLKLMHDEDYDDGYLRSIHISDEMIREEIKYNSEVALTEYMDKMELTGQEREDYKKMISIILSGLTDTEATDGQSYSSPSSIRKKLALRGEWSDNQEKAYQAIIKGDFNINHLGIILQSAEKPFVTSDMAKYSGSTTMELRKTPLQDKNSEYLIILAEALARGASKRSKLVALCDFMEDTHREGDGKHGIDTAHFASVNKVGKSGVIDISEFDEVFDRKLANGEVSEEDYNAQLTEYIHWHVRTKGSNQQSKQDQEDYENQERLVNEGKLKKEEAYYNSQYVDTVPVEDYIIQQEVPAHLLEHQQLYGSQIRILGISDITPGTEFEVRGKTMSGEELINEYKELHAQNIRESFSELMQELGLDKLQEFIDKYNKENIDEGVIIESLANLPIGTQERNDVFEDLHFLLQKELSKDAKYGLDMRRACSLQYDSNGNVVDFVVPLMDPIQSKRIQMLLNSIIKKSVNKQRITGGPVVQATAYDRDLHIRFKDKKGNILPTFEEYKGNNEQITVDDYKIFLKTKQAGIAYFECYMPVPNAELERLMLKEDGSMMSFEELKQKLPEKVFNSMMQVIGYRIPTEDKYSMIPLKIMGFVPRAAGQVIMMPQEITYLTGSDFDIDKMYIMMKAFDTTVPDANEDGFADAIKEQYIKETSSLYFKGINEVVKQVITNGNRILAGDDFYHWTTGIDEKDQNVLKFIEWYKDYLIKETFNEFTNQNTSNKRDAREARNNRILDLQWSVLTNEDTMSKMLNPGNFLEQKKVGRMIKVIKSGAINPKTKEKWEWDELSDMEISDLDDLLENTNPHNTTLPSSKIYFQRQNMQGSQMVGIFANNNVSHAFLTFQKIGIDLTKNKRNGTFMFDGKLIGDPDHMIVIDPQRGFNGQLISKTIASFLAASVDTAKDPTLSDMNVNTFTGGVAMVLARMGFDTESIGLFLSQPVIMQLSDLYFKKSTESHYNGNTALEDLAADLGMKKKELQSTEGIRDLTLSKENFIEHLNDTDYDDSEDNFQKRVLCGFYALYQMAQDLQELTFCTKFNSVSNAVGPTIADTMEDQRRVERFFDSLDSNIFYEPSTDTEEYTSVTNVIESDPILAAFYESTVGNNGASERIFKNFFPHYFPGFKNVLKHFQEEYMGGKKLSSKLYNQLLDEYLYYMLTYGDENYAPTLPSNFEDKNRLVSDLVSQFQEVLKIPGRKPNMLLDQNLGANCLRVRERDEFIATDTLIFNGSQLNSEGQQKIRNAWSDLITMQDPNLSKEDNERIRRFGVDLFFYTLMRNGFGFSPKTLMHLASTIVRYNARYDTGFNSYIKGLRNLKDVDGFLMSDDTDQINRFCSQFIRNHSNNKQLVPNVDAQNAIINIVEEGNIEFSAPADNTSKLSQIMVGDNPSRFVTVTTKTGNKLSSVLYELVKVAGEDITYEGGEAKVRYKKSNRLGFVNNFIEYDANSDLDVSYFEELRNNSADAMEEEISAPEQERDEIEQVQGQQDENPASEKEVTLFQKVKMAMYETIEETGKFTEYEDDHNDYLNKLRKVWIKSGKDAESDLGKAFNELITTKVSDRPEIMEKIESIYKKQDKC